MATFYGNHVQTIDTKRRLPITAAFREMIDPERDGSGFVLLLSPEDGHLRLYPERYFGELIEAARESSASGAEFREMAELFSEGRALKPDAQGRVVLPADVLAEANLPNEVVLRGIDDHIELWPVDQWQAARAKVKPADFQEILFQAGRLLAAGARGKRPRE